MTRRGVLSGVVLGAATALALTGCAGVPRSSAPEVIRTVQLGGAGTQSTVTPVPGVGPQALVQDFLSASEIDTGGHASARTFLTAAARTRWSDSTVTVVDATTVGAYDAVRREVVVRARVLGTLDPNGRYTPTLQSSTAATVPFVFGLVRVDGQYRVNDLPTGLLLTQDQFTASFTQRPLYFYDLAQRYLVPDARWTSLTDPTQLAQWLLNQLAAGPTAALQNAVSSATFAAQGTTTRRITVTEGSPVRIEIPGAGQLAAGLRNELAAQVANTLADFDRGRTLEITDSGVPVTIPSAGRAPFATTEFGDAIGPAPPSADVYYLRDGRVVAADGSVLRGAIDNGDYDLTSFAVSRAESASTLSVAAVATVQQTPRLLIGTQTAGLRPTSITGVTSRPAFAPARDEAWVGAGTKIYRIVLTGSARPAVVPLPTTAAGGRIVALRLSPEGSRIAMVIDSAAGGNHLFVGSVVRSPGQVRIDTLQQISPEGTSVDDLAWVESTRLFAVGSSGRSDVPHVFDVRVDGSSWTERSIGRLPSGPTSLTIALQYPAWVTAGSTVWVQSGGTDWRSADPHRSSTPGRAPVYLE